MSKGLLLPSLGHLVVVTLCCEHEAMNMHRSNFDTDQVNSSSESDLILENVTLALHDELLKCDAVKHSSEIDIKSHRKPGSGFSLCIN